MTATTACGTDAKPDKSVQITSCGTNKPSAAKHATGDPQILRIGHTDLYLPISWLRYNGMITDSAGNPCTYPLSDYLTPIFRDDDKANTIHTLFRNPEMMAHGLQFRISNSSLRANDRRMTDQPAGVDPQSSVYEIAFAGRPAGQPDNGAVEKQRATLKSSTQDNGWVLIEDYYYDVAGKYRKDHVADEFPTDASPSAADQYAQFRFNGDIVVSYRRVGIGPRLVEFERWRSDRRTVDALVRWLATPPAQRDNGPKILGGRRPPMGKD